MGAVRQDLDGGNGIRSDRFPLHSRGNAHVDRERNSDWHHLVLLDDLLWP